MDRAGHRRRPARATAGWVRGLAPGGCESPDAMEERGRPPAFTLTDEGEDGSGSSRAGPGVNVDQQGQRSGGAHGLVAGQSCGSAAGRARGLAARQVRELAARRAREPARVARERGGRSEHGGRASERESGSEKVWPGGVRQGHAGYG
jgi:hypothetical protein